MRLFYILLILFHSQLIRAQTAELTIQNQSIVGNEFSFDIYVRSLSGSTDIYLANSDFVLRFNRPAFSDPTISKVPDQAPGLCSFVPTAGDPDGVRIRYYSNTAPIISGNKIILNLSGPGPTSTMAFAEFVAKIDGTANTHCLGRFKVTGMVGGATGLEWDNSGTYISSYADQAPVYPANEITSVNIDPISLVLPVELVGFNGHLSDEGVVVLTWSTLTETENQGFYLQRQSNAESEWTAIGDVTGSGNSTTQIDYTYIDQFPQRGINKYRIKQIDFDGSFKFSPIIAVELTRSENLVYPNPVQDHLRLAGTARGAYRITDLSGNTVLSGKVTSNLLSVAELARGSYLIWIEGHQNKFIKW